MAAEAQVLVAVAAGLCHNLSQAVAVLSYDGLLSRRADAPLIRLITPASPDAKSAQERQRISDISAVLRIIGSIL